MMESHRSLRHIVMPRGAHSGGSHRVLPVGTVRTRMVRGILVLALALAGLGITALALPAHHGVIPARAHPAGSAMMISPFRPWIY